MEESAFLFRNRAAQCTTGPGIAAAIPVDSRDVSRSIKSFGSAKTFQDLGLRALNRAVLFKILKGIAVSERDSDFAQCPENYRSRFLDRQMLARFAADPENDLSQNFVDDALAKGDECYGILNGETLAAYSWYSNSPTAIDPPELRLYFDPRYIYMYKGFTHASHRGRRLHALGMTRALQAYLQRGYKGMLAYVEWNNFASLRSCYRMGYSDFGTITVMRVFGRFLARSSPGCEAYGFRLECDPHCSRSVSCVAP